MEQLREYIRRPDAGAIIEGGKFPYQNRTVLFVLRYPAMRALHQCRIQRYDVIEIAKTQHTTQLLKSHFQLGGSQFGV